MIVRYNIIDETDQETFITRLNELVNDEGYSPIGNMILYQDGKTHFTILLFKTFE